jgi:hypothetical protein
MYIYIYMYKPNISYKKKDEKHEQDDISCRRKKNDSDL